MTEYNIEFLASAAKEFKSLDTNMKRRIGSVINDLQNNPRPIGMRKLKGHDRLYRLRVGHFRVVYEIDDHTKTILITRIRRRQEAYQ